MIVRHGERADDVTTDWHRPGRVRPHDPPLTPPGHVQAALTGRALAGTVDVLVASPCTRTVETAVAIAKATGAQIGIEPGVSEWLNADWFPNGVPSWRSAAELDALFPGAINLGYKAVLDRAPRAFESPADTMERVTATLKKIRERYRDKSVVVVTHGFLPQAAYALFVGRPPAPLPVAPYASITEFRFSAADRINRGKAERVCDASHWLNA
jgi:broad specificity phosphatase PhoE